MNYDLTNQDKASNACPNRMYKIKVHGIDTLVFKDGNGVARFYGAGGLENAKLFVSCKEKSDEVFTRNGEAVSQEH